MFEEADLILGARGMIGPVNFFGCMRLLESGVGRVERRLEIDGMSRATVDRGDWEPWLLKEAVLGSVVRSDGVKTSQMKPTSLPDEHSCLKAMLSQN